MKNFLDKCLPTASEEDMVAALTELINEANIECKKLAEEDPMASWTYSKECVLSEHEIYD